ncbi:uncharacterized protein LOC130922297 [Corythoichthys intestinalis]|uniref:uncharacterized protein LOC130922297 n=1 Tax=Corythoichthys intestinalis TaxID=161448 RepID=UPI0025A54378|nr:uncharacterized protein LOC130922297 [Corythoichthys intestinalis]
MAAVNRPTTARPPPEVDIHFRATGGVPSTGQQDQGLQGTSQEPTSHPHLHPRPVFYVPAPPPPPFLQYQWPMPFPYNSFPGFPGMGYGMVMPPFPPPPYMEAQAYIMPHPHVQPVDYRRFLHAPLMGQGPLHQNPNQTRRARAPCTFPVKETANSQVQTECSDGSCSDKDSGRGTASCSPSSSSCSQKGSAEVGTDTRHRSCAENDNQVTEKINSCKQDCVSRPAENIGTNLSCKMLENQNRLAGVANPENPPKTTVHCNRWSVSSQDCMVPLCSSSQQEDEIIKERSITVPDILTRWGGDTPQEEVPKVSAKELPHDDRLESKTDQEYEGLLHPSATNTKNVPMLDDDDDNDVSAKEIFSKNDTIQELLLESRREIEAFGSSISKTQPQNKCEHWLNKSNEVQAMENDGVTSSHEGTTNFPYKLHLSASAGNRKLNESVWSVESYAPFIPNKEWLMLNGLFDTRMIAELNENPEEKELSKKNFDFKANHDGRVSPRFSSSAPPMSDPWLGISPPAEMNQSQMKKDEKVQNSEIAGSPEKDSLTCLQSNNTASNEDGGENGSSEPVANQSPNQDLCFTARQAGSPCTADQEGTSTSSSSAEYIPSIAQSTPNNVEATESGNVELCTEESHLKTQRCVAELSPGSTGHCVVIGFHCDGIHKSIYTYEELKSNGGLIGKHSGTRNGKTEGVSMNGRIQKTRRKCGSLRNKWHGGKHNNHGENVYSGEPKLKGDGENLQC